MDYPGFKLGQLNTDCRVCVLDQFTILPLCHANLFPKSFLLLLIGNYKNRLLDHWSSFLLSFAFPYRLCTFCNYPMVLGYSVLFFSFFFLQFNWLSLHWYIFKFTDSSAQSTDETIKDISVTVTLKSIIILQIFFFSFDLSAYTIHCWLYLLVLLIHKS